MSWRIVVISKRAKLDYQLGYLVVRNEEVTKIQGAFVISFHYRYFVKFMQYQPF